MSTFLKASIKQSVSGKVKRAVPDGESSAKRHVHLQGTSLQSPCWGMLTHRHSLLLVRYSLLLVRHSSGTHAEKYKKILDPVGGCAAETRHSLVTGLISPGRPGTRAPSRQVSEPPVILCVSCVWSMKHCVYCTHGSTTRPR